MRIWDIHPGYLNRQSLLGEHRELHGIVSIHANRKKGYSRHPETMRWSGHGWALKQRHRMLAAEMVLRGYNDRSPVELATGPEQWPEIYLDSPLEQFELLREKYQDREQGRIPLPRNGQQLWSHHKYSILARNVILYRKIGREVAEMTGERDYSNLATVVTEQLRVRPSPGGVRNSLQHMWGYVSDYFSGDKREVESWTDAGLLAEIRKLAVAHGERYLLCQTALSELAVWIVEFEGLGD